MTAKKYKVVGQTSIIGSDGVSVPTGGTITLDPDDPTPGATNVAALLSGGHLEEVTSRTSSVTAKEEKYKGA